MGHSMVLILILICIVIIAIVFLKNKEAFTGQIDKTMMKYSLKEYGMEKCDSLTLSNLETNADLMRLKYVGGLRMNKFKPVDASKLKANRSYCAIYNDLQQNIQDYLMGMTTCSMQNPKFNGSPFITNVYSDSSQSYALGVPINSCVIEIDDTKITAANLSAFWNAFGISHCADLYNEWNQEVQACNEATASYNAFVAKQLASFREFGNEIQRKIDAMEPVLASNLQALSDIIGKLATCTADMERCQADIAVVQRDIRSIQTDLAGPIKENLYNVSQKNIKNLNVNIGQINKLIDQNKGCANNTAVYNASIENLKARQMQEEALYSLLQSLNSDMLDLISKYNGYITLLQNSNASYLKNIADLNASIATIQSEINAEQVLLNTCNSNLIVMQQYDEILQQCRIESRPYPEAIRITLSNLNAEKIKYFKMNASNNDCNQWTVNNQDVLSNITNMYGVCSNNTGVILNNNTQCSSDRITCYDDLTKAKRVITNLNNVIDNNTTNIINLTNDLLKCKTSIANSVKQANSTITNTQTALNSSSTCLNTGTLQANIQVAIATLSNLQSQSQNQIMAPIQSCNDLDTLAQIKECQLISPSNCPWPCGGVSPDFMYNLTCPGPMGTLTTCAPSSCTANFTGTPSGTIQCLNGIYTNYNLSGCTAPAGCTVPPTNGYIMNCDTSSTTKSGANCEARACDTNAGYSGTALGGYGQCTNGVWSSPGGPTGCIAPKTCDPPSYPGYGSGLMQGDAINASMLYSGGACDPGYSGNSSGALLKCDTVTGSWTGAPPTGCTLVPACTINGIAFSLSDPIGNSSAPDGSTISRMAPGYGVIFNPDNVRLKTITVSTNSAVKTCKIVPINQQKELNKGKVIGAAIGGALSLGIGAVARAGTTALAGAVSGGTIAGAVGGSGFYDLYANECLVTIGPSVNNQVINIATNCPRTDGQAGDNNMGGEYLAYVYKIT